MNTVDFHLPGTLRLFKQINRATCWIFPGFPILDKPGSQVALGFYHLKFRAGGALPASLTQDAPTAQLIKTNLIFSWQDWERIFLANFGSGAGFREKTALGSGRYGREIQDDEVFGSAPVNVQLLMLEILPPDAEEDTQMISA